MKMTIGSVAPLALALLTACGSSKEQTKAGDEKASAGQTAASEQAVQMETDGNTAIERIDVNGDGKPDVFKYYRLADSAAKGQAGSADGVKGQKKVLIRKEMDINFDQRIDVVEYYEGEAGKEQKIREEMDLDFDSRVDMTRHYKDGNVTLVEMDLGFDGKTDTWNYYQLTTGEDGKQVNRLIERRKDNNGDGKVDEWQYYTKGNLSKIGTDTNGDGQPDQFTRVDEKK